MALTLGRLDRGPHLPTLVASSITREIAQGRLKPGDQLPTEQSLAETFGVSRNVVREAIARLRVEGRVWSRQGRGAFVSATPQTNLLTIEHDDAQPEDVFAALFQFRGILEVQGAALAAQLRTPDDLDRIREAVEAMAAAPYGSILWLNGDLAFHHAIASATHNTYFVQVLAFVAEKVRESILSAGGQSHSENMAQATEREHRSILAAIEMQDEAAARNAMKDHLAGAASRIGTTIATEGMKSSL
ncbi:FadR/GntR family transcriptional regulator [Acidisoma silvae]|uniref:FadR family transcriptional regulator n=1 Tax=Acidisoma silvae TaxID=2802396 RepID=A0A964E127_9PROT|nr:FadR/GntR family transcriptional regulator [Acidisoma silvae]MCB8877769.1 FadR family transcriptional regulator [Acidisoma silvae]